ncbi:MAG: alanine dehydrogenase, partial [Myxococcales bacterium]|nr:alanine dehydrogenase [Myxococcales bacterium]
LVDRAMISTMKKGSVIVDVAVDQGGCIETVRPTTHDDPTYEVDGVVHYCVANMPGAVAQTSTFALTNVTLRYAERIASLGAIEALKRDPGFAKGVNCWDGFCTYGAVAEGVGVPHTPIETILG